MDLFNWLFGKAKAPETPKPISCDQCWRPATVYVPTSDGNLHYCDACFKEIWRGACRGLPIGSIND